MKKEFKKEFIEIQELLNTLNGKGMRTFIDRLSFPKILLLWILIVIFFGLAYFFLAGEKTFLFYDSLQKPVSSVWDSIYFSFVASTTAGFGDILPSGAFKIITILELISGLILLAFVTSKLVSIKQDQILGEIYEFSFQEKINHLRSSLLLFRQNLNKVIDKVESGLAKKREVRELYLYFSSFEDVLNDSIMLLKRKSRRYTKSVNSVDTELILNSTLSSLEKINELIQTVNEHKLDWRREVTLNIIGRCLKLVEELFLVVSSSSLLDEKKFAEVEQQKKTTVEKINKSVKANEEAVSGTVSGAGPAAG